MKAKAIKVEGAHSHCDVVYYHYNDDGWGAVDMAVTTTLEDVLDLGDSANIKIEIVEVDKQWLDNLLPANEF